MSRTGAVRQPVVRIQAQHPRHDLGVTGIAELVGGQGQPTGPHLPQAARTGEDQRAGRIRDRHIESLRIKVDRVFGPSHDIKRAVGLLGIEKFRVVLTCAYEAPLKKHPCNGVVIFVNRHRFKHAPLLQRQLARFYSAGATVQRPP